MPSSEAILSRLQERTAGSALPRSFYTSADDYQLDLGMLWYREWIFAGHDCEIGNAGNYLTVQVGEYPVVIVRGRDGAIRAFHNSCRHRGSRICSGERGSAPRLVCPYHQWTYQLDGRLIAARDMGPHFDRARYSLKPVHCNTVGGYIWICLGAQAPDFAPIRAQMEPYLLPHRLGKAKLAFESTIIERANWKLVWENNRECYHCAVNHPELCRTYPATPTIIGGEEAVQNPRVAQMWARWEAAGLPSRFQLSSSGQHRVARMPLIEGAVSYTLDGKVAVDRPLSPAISEPDIGALLMFHYPSTWNHVLGDYAISFRVLPISPNETQLTTKWLVNEEAAEGVDYDLKRMTEVWLATNEEDRRVCQENQAGVSSPAYEPAPYSPVQEAGVVQFVDWYCSQLAARVTENGISAAGP